MWWVFIALLVSSCGSPAKRSPREKYRSGLEKAGLLGSRLGQLWLAAADSALVSPIAVALPFSETGYFEMENPSAAGYVLSVKEGERLIVDWSARPASGYALFVELWQARPNDEPRMMAAPDTSLNRLERVIDEEGEYILRIQPELLQGAAYTVSIYTAPSLAYPVHKRGNPRLMSPWGAERDAGARSHEGVDIGAPRGTAAIAAADGRITRVTWNSLGGKVVFMRTKDRAYNLYYAHLDSQLVRSGQYVSAGDTIGLIGNTGNAVTTPPHLHFGIYGARGAVDPFPFINSDRGEPKEVTADTSRLTEYGSTTANASLHESASTDSDRLIGLSAGTVVKLIAASGPFYKVLLPSDQQGYIASSLIDITGLGEKQLSDSATLLAGPSEGSVVKAKIAPGRNLTLLGSWDDYLFVQWGKTRGWIRKPPR